jgi:hypothetical protein
MYRLTKAKRFDDTFVEGVIRLSDNACIPFDPANSDYQEFLRWCEAGNEPLPADSQE